MSIFKLEDLFPRLRDKIKINEDGCWLWTAGKFSAGYGCFKIEKKSRLTHIVVWEELVGTIPEGLDLDHYRMNPGIRNAPCDRACCNPQHLEPKPSKANTLEGSGITAINARKTHCNHGHEFTEENTYLWVDKSGNTKRICKTCNRIRALKYYHDNKDK